MAMLDALFQLMVTKGASDMHLSCGEKPIFRIAGTITRLDEFGEITPEDAQSVLTEVMPERNRQEFEEKKDTDFAYSLEGFGRYRCNIFEDRKGWGGVFRLIPSKILSFEQLNLPAVCKEFCQLPKGLVVVTGPTGSGKSTTLAAMIDWININRHDHILTIEDPVEFVHPNKNCLINQREVHRHTMSFKNALRAALREDPDIVLVGEMRDLETVQIAIETAETGHLVYGTLHTNTAASTIDRIIDQFPADRQQQIRVMLSTSLKGVVAQNLLKKIGGGRLAALEILVVTSGISSMIREGKTYQIGSAMQVGKKYGMVTLNDALLAHVAAERVTPEEAFFKAADKAEFLKRLKEEVGKSVNASVVKLDT
ncbi:MAG TPA: type IV pilus twitching motility protein PilT [Planctomycetota bacterium]|nr:type IV pilus twitching motility protein PilT [Planctomycetota bacterium]